MANNNNNDDGGDKDRSEVQHNYSTGKPLDCQACHMMGNDISVKTIQTDIVTKISFYFCSSQPVSRPNKKGKSLLKLCQVGESSLFLTLKMYPSLPGLRFLL